MQRLNELVARAMESAGLSQYAVAVGAGVHQGNLSVWLRFGTTSLGWEKRRAVVEFMRQHVGNEDYALMVEALGERTGPFGRGDG